MATALVGMGSNLGDRQAALDAAVAALAGRVDLQVAAVSGFREMAPIGGPQDQPAYLNAALRLETELDPPSLLHVLQGVENGLGRVRSERWGPRTIDLDLLLYDDLTLDTLKLTLPHPRMSFRRFVLEPAAEVGGAMVHPTTGWTVARLLEHLNTAANYTAVTGLDWTLAKPLARALCDVLEGEFVGFPDVAVKSVAEDSSGTGPWGLSPAAVVEQARFLSHNVWLVAPRWVVSYGWLDFAVRHVRVDSAANDRQRAVEIVAKETRPKLTVVWNTPLEQTPTFGGPLARSDSWNEDNFLRPLADLWQPLHDLAHEPGHGPVMYLETPDFDSALAEAVAAVRAMD